MAGGRRARGEDYRARGAYNGRTAARSTRTLGLSRNAVTTESDTDAEKRSNECVTHSHPVPADKLGLYSVERDPHSEADIASYVEGQARGEAVQHVERIKHEMILGERYDIWDVVTDKNRWWVITNLTNLYSQRHFPSLDYTLSFHIGLMARLRNRSGRVDADEPSPFDEVFRRVDQAERKHEEGIESEDFQAVGMQLRESLISLVAALRRRVPIQASDERPQDANVIAWLDLFMSEMCAGGTNKELRQHLKNTGKETWQLVNWLVHHRGADQVVASIAIHACQTLIGHVVQLIERKQSAAIDRCPVCASRKIRTHFDISIPPDGDYYVSCGTCTWTNHP